MLYRQKFSTFIRQYSDRQSGGTIGYITNKDEAKDLVLDASGAIFLAALSRTPRCLENIACEIVKHFTDIGTEELKPDIIEFYQMLEDNGFIVSGETEAELDAKDAPFSYTALDLNFIKNDFTPIFHREHESSKDFLSEYFKNNPNLTQFQIEITNRCNERCVHCYIPHEEKVADIDDALFYDVLDQCRDMGVLSLTLSGGEPMLHQSFIDYIRKSGEYDFSINILSNLTLLNNALIAEMKSSRLVTVQASLYSMKPEVHDSITTVSGSCEKTKNAILRLIENDIPVQISCPAMKQNKNDYSEVFAWAHEHHIKAATDYIMMARYNHSIDNLDNRLSLDEVRALINEIVNNNPDYQKIIAASDCDKSNAYNKADKIVCSVCALSLCMGVNGNVYPCAGWQNLLGNIKDTPLRDIWENSPDVRYLRSIRTKDFPKCITCQDSMFCNMCMARNANENEGNPLKIIDYYCEVAAINREIVMEWKEKYQGGEHND